MVVSARRFFESDPRNVAPEPASLSARARARRRSPLAARTQDLHSSRRIDRKRAHTRALGDARELRPGLQNLRALARHRGDTVFHEP